MAQGTGQLRPRQAYRGICTEKNSHIDLACQITVAEAILAEKEINCSPPCSQGLPEDNVPEVMVMAALGIRRCHGCKREILKQNCQSPQRFSVLVASSSNMEKKGLRRLATMLGKCLFSLKKSHTFSYTIIHLQLNM